MLCPPLLWRHNERDGVSNHRCLDCLLNRLFRRRSKKTSKLCVTGLCEGNPPVTGGFPSQRASCAKKNLHDYVTMSIVVMGISVCRNDLQCDQQRQSGHHDNSQFSFLPLWSWWIPVHNAYSLNVLTGKHVSMMTSSNGNIFRVTGHLCGEFAGH